MAFDGNFAGKIAKELSIAIDSHIDKIYQPSNDEIILGLRKKGFAKRLIISVKNGMARIHFTELRPENPATPPMFCMLFRKLFSGAKLTAVNQSGFERLIELCFETSNEMGDRVIRRIIAELIGNQSNLILIDENGKIIDALRRSDILSKKRLIQPGAKYSCPESQPKYDIKTYDADFILEKIKENSSAPISKAILTTIGGISPLVADEIVFRAGLLDAPVEEIKDFGTLKEQIGLYKDSCLCSGTPFMLLKDGVPYDFSYMEITHFKGLYEGKTFDSYSALLDAFYFERAKNQEKSRITGEVSKLVSTLITRAEKRLNNRIKELKSTENREDLRIKGELIKANISNIEPGATEVSVQNYYDENLSLITIKLDPSLNGQNNASKYFKEYKKRSVAAVTLKDLIDSDKAEKEYLETVLDNLSRCQTSSDLSRIKEELRIAGYIKKGGNTRKSKSFQPNFDEYESIEGFRIIVGKNNIQNDLITTKMASKNDVWFHTKNIHGAHVVVFSDGRDLSDETVLFAAKLAAKNSKASNSSNVPVDYTRIKFVKKPSGAKPGMVIYTDNKTVFVTP